MPGFGGKRERRKQGKMGTVEKHWEPIRIRGNHGGERGSVTCSKFRCRNNRGTGWALQPTQGGRTTGLKQLGRLFLKITLIPSSGIKGHYSLHHPLLLHKVFKGTRGGTGHSQCGRPQYSQGYQSWQLSRFFWSVRPHNESNLLRNF